MLRILTLVTLCFMALVGHAQDTAPSKTHGTVNILFANKNGLALVTDSRLSNAAGAPVGEGPKLFVLDDHTVCAIAGFYTNPGPIINGSAPAYTSVPGIIKTLKQNANSHDSASLKLQDLSNIYSFTLAKLANLDLAQNPSQTPSPAELTMASYDNDQLDISQVRLDPVWQYGMWEYKQTGRLDQIVRNGLIQRFAGFTDIAWRIMGNPSNKEVASDPVLSYFFSDLAQHNGTNLTVDDLRRTAVQFEARTSRAHPNLVGGHIQWVTMAHGHITGSDLLPPEQNQERTGSVIGNQISNLVITGAPGSRSDIFEPSASGDVLSSIHVNVLIFRIRQSLDGKAFLRSHFVDCTLEYRGTGPTLFDVHNTVSDCTLEVSAAVREDDDLLVMIRKNFPAMKIVRVP
jgi:hypothetical protein